MLNHITFISKYDKLVSSQTNKMKAKKYHCRTCSHGFKTEELLKKHEEQGCLAVEGDKVEMPTANHFKKLKAPFVIYADFECLTVPIDMKNKSAKAKSMSYPNHRPD